VAYLQGSCDSSLLASLEETLDHLEVSALTMGIQSLKELLIKKSFLHPMPSVFLTQRPDVACSYLTEGYILLLVDNSPLALVLPCTLFQFTQSPVDYYKSPIVGTYLRLIRFLCLLISLFLMPVFLLLALNPGWLPPALQTLVPADVSGTAVFIYVLFVELGLDLFKYASSHTSNGFSGTFGIVGGLLIGDMAIKLSWASTEVIFYGAATLLASLGLPGIELRDAIKIYRLFLILCTGFFSWPGFWVGLFLVFLSLITTPVYGNKSYFWPLFPFRWDALKTLLFRYPTFKAQPENQKSPE
jgi:stage V sporulation protein AF